MTVPPLPDNFLRGMHLAEFVAGIASPPTKAMLEKIEPLLPDLQQDGQAIIADLMKLWTIVAPAVTPVLAALAHHVQQGATVTEAAAKVQQRTVQLLPPPDQQEGGR